MIDSGLYPDFLAHSLNNIVWNPPAMVGDVKGADVANEIRNNYIDLIRIAHLSKKTPIDQNMYEGILGVRIVGFRATIMSHR